MLGFADRHRIEDLVMAAAKKAIDYIDANALFTRRPGGYSTGTATNEGENENTGESEVNTDTTGVADTVQAGTGKTETTQNGTSDAKNKTTDLKREPALYPAYFGGLPDPRTANKIGGVYTSPIAPAWKAELTFEELKPELDNPNALRSVPKFVEWPNVIELEKSCPWDDADYKRLGVEPPVYVNVQIIPHALSPHLTVQGRLADLREEEPVRLHQEEGSAGAFPDDFDFDGE